MVLRFFEQQGMQTALSFVLTKSKLRLDETLLTLATIFDGDAIRGDDQICFEV